MHPSVTHALYVLLQVPLVLQAVPARAEEKLPVLEPVEETWVYASSRYVGRPPENPDSWLKGGA